MLNIAKSCETKEDFQNVFGLSPEGIDPIVLPDKLIIGIDWLSVYKVTKVKVKVKLKHVCFVLSDECMRLH